MDFVLVYAGLASVCYQFRSYKICIVLVGIGVEPTSQNIQVYMKLLIGGSIAETIIDYAKTNDVDIIVVGTKSMSGMQNSLLGSVANK